MFAELQVIIINLSSRHLPFEEANTSHAAKMAPITDISSALYGKWGCLATSRDMLFTSLGEEVTGDVRLPTAAQCAAHLELLDAFVILKSKVTRWGQSRGFEPEASWQMFVKLAVVRFTTWIRSVDPCSMKDSLPPLGMYRQFLMRWKANGAHERRHINGLALLHAQSQLLRQFLQDCSSSPLVPRWDLLGSCGTYLNTSSH